MRIPQPNRVTRARIGFQGSCSESSSDSDRDSSNDSFLCLEESSSDDEIDSQGSPSSDDSSKMIAMMGFFSSIPQQRCITEASYGPDKKKKEKKKQVPTEFFASMKGVDELMQAQGRDTKPLSLADLELKLLEVKNECADQRRLIMELHSAIHSYSEDNRRLWRHSTSHRRHRRQNHPTWNFFYQEKLSYKERIHVESSTPILRAIPTEEAV
jgi:hypothetical protein